MLRRIAAPLALAILALSTAARAQTDFVAPSDVIWEKDIEYNRVGDLSLRFDVLKPADRPPGRLPVIVYIHGGGFTKGSKEEGLSRNLPFARDGYYTVSIDYRLAPEWTFPAPVEDCKAAIRYLRANARRLGIDPRRIGAWGTSAGGSLVSLLGTSAGVRELDGTGNLGWSSRVQCVVDGYGVTDWLTVTDQRALVDGSDFFERGYFGGDLEDVLDAAILASAVTHVSSDDPPFLHLHGTEDPVVPFAQSEELQRALTEQGVDAILVPIVGAAHGWRPGHPDVEARMMDFFDKHLRGADLEVSSEPIEK